MKNLKITFVFLVLIVMASCSDDFVDVKSNNENSEDFFNSEEDYFFIRDDDFFIREGRVLGGRS